MHWPMKAFWGIQPRRFSKLLLQHDCVLLRGANRGVAMAV